MLDGGAALGPHHWQGGGLGQNLGQVAYWPGMKDDKDRGWQVGRQVGQDGPKRFQGPARAADDDDVVGPWGGGGRCQGGPPRARGQGQEAALDLPVEDAARMSGPVVWPASIMSITLRNSSGSKGLEISGARRNCCGISDRWL